MFQGAVDLFIDGIAYEGEIAGTGEGTTPPDNDSNSIEGSLCRCPNGSDTNDNSVDFVFCTTLTPGAANVCP
jgi:hypothetical protein